MKKQKYIVSCDKKYRFNTIDFAIAKRKGRTIKKDSTGKYVVQIDEQIYSGELVQRKQNKYTIEINGNQYDFVIDTETSYKRKVARAAELGKTGAFHLKSPMPGKICEVFVTKGSSVKKGEPLLILEAMKMQNQVLASVDAIVTAVHVKKNDTVFSEQVLLELEKQ